MGHLHLPPRARRAGLLLLLPVVLFACGGLAGLFMAGQPRVLVYPGAAPSTAVPAQQLGLYGAFETTDSVDLVAAWYTAQGLAGSPELLGGRESASGGRGQPWRLALPGRALLVGRVVHYRAVAAARGTLITLWCDPPCRPGDSFWNGLLGGP